MLSPAQRAEVIPVLRERLADLRCSRSIARVAQGESHPVVGDLTRRITLVDSVVRALDVPTHMDQLS